jgi:hypothetical protein
MHYIRSALLGVFILVSTGKAISQEMLGIVNSTYSGINGALINPALPVSSPFYLDINVLTAGLFFENNYLYLAKNEYRFRRFLQSNRNFPTHPPDGKFYYDYYTPPDKKGYANIRMIGPSGLLVIGRQAFGMYMGARSASFTRNVPFDLAKFMFEGFTFPPQYHTRFIHPNMKMSAATLNWAEFGLNYSYILRNREFDFWKGGTTLKVLKGFAGGYAEASMLDYMVPDRDTLIIYHLDAESGIALPIDYQNNEFLTSPLFSGNGFGLDLGFIYEQKLRSTDNSFKFRSLCSQTYIPYKLRVGFSVLDLGWINFSRNARKILIKDGNMVWEGINHTAFSNVNDFIAQVSNEFYGNPNQLVVDDKIRIGLPTALSLQADYNYFKNWFVNGTVVIPVTIMKPSVKRASLIAVAPRFDTRNFGFGAVISMLDWYKYQFGINAHFRGFYLGTEKLGSFFHFKDFTGLDIYAGLRISFLKGHCRSSQSSECSHNEYMRFKVKQKRSGMFRLR